MEFKKVCIEDKKGIKTLSELASKIIKLHFDPIIGSEQNDYMIKKFQSVKSITEQIVSGYNYYFVLDNKIIIGFLAFYPKDNKMYLSKFYLDSKYRGKGFAGKMFKFIKDETIKNNLSKIFLHINKNNIKVIQIYEHFGFKKVREEKTDIGNNYVMDDFVLEYKINNKCNK